MADLPTPVVFDLDGTLIDSLGSITKAANRVLDGRGLAPIPASQAAGYVGLGEQVFIDHLIADTDLKSAQRPAILNDLMAHYTEISKQTVLFEGVPDMLSCFAQRGIAMGLCTNKPGGPTAAVLESTGLGRFFDVVVAGDSLPVRKPDAAPLLTCFTALGRKGLFVGDSPVDAQTAQAAQVPFALFTEGIRTVPLEAIPHDIAFSNMTQLEPAYDALQWGVSGP